jgi:hypothetical protein
MLSRYEIKTKDDQTQTVTVFVYGELLHTARFVCGKMHALLFRNWKNRVKGRDWYDFEWYVRNNIPLNFEHLQQRAEQINAISKNDFTKETFKTLLKERILKTDINAVKNDVRPFIKTPAEMDIWSSDYFLQLVDMIKSNE